MSVLFGWGQNLMSYLLSLIMGAVSGSIFSFLLLRFKILLPYELTQENVVDFQLLLVEPENPYNVLPKRGENDTTLATVLNNASLVATVIQAAATRSTHVVEIDDLQQRELIMNAILKSVNSYYCRAGLRARFLQKPVLILPAHIAIVEEETVNAKILHILVIRDDSLTSIAEIIAEAMQRGPLDKRLHTLQNILHIMDEEDVQKLDDKHRTIRPMELTFVA